MLAGYGREAAFLLEEGALSQEVDAALVALGMPMGPFQMGDMAGLDIGWHIRKQRGKPEGVRYSPGAVVYVHGYGFPAWRGGPMFWAQHLGLSNVLETIRQFRDTHGPLWEPAPLLERMVAEGARFDA